MIRRGITPRQLELLRAVAGAGSLAAALRTLGLTGAPGQITSLRRRGLLEWGSARLTPAGWRAIMHPASTSEVAAATDADWAAWASEEEV